MACRISRRMRCLCAGWNRWRWPSIVDTERNPDRSSVTGPTFRLELPLFNQGQARVAKSEAELRRAERKLEGLAIDIRS